MSEKSLNSKIASVEYLKNSFIFEIKNAEEDNNLSKVDFLSEGSYSDFKKTYSRIENMVLTSNKPVVIRNFNLNEEETEKIMEKIENLNFVEVNSDNSNDLKKISKEKEKNFETILNFFDDIKEEVYSKNSFTLTKEKLSDNYKNEKELTKTLNLVEDLSCNYNNKFDFNVIKKDDSTKFKVLVGDKEFISTDYKKLKKDLLEDLIDKNKSVEDKIKEKYNDDYMKTDYNFSLEKNFKFTYKNKGMDNKGNDKIETHITVDKGNESFELSGVGTDFNLGEINRLLGMKDYIETYNKAREKNQGYEFTKETVIDTIPPKFYDNIDKIKEKNDVDFSKLEDMKGKETFEDTLNDIKANIFIRGFDTKEKDNIKEIVKERGDYLFENRILEMPNLENYLENKVKEEDKTFKDELTLVEIDGKERIKEFVENRNFDEIEYKNNMKEYLVSKMSNAIEEVNKNIDEVDKEVFKRHFNLVSGKYLNKETGTIRLENNFIKDRIAITLDEKAPNYPKEKKDFEKNNKNSLSYETEKLYLDKNFKKELVKDLEEHNIKLSNDKLDDVIKSFNGNKYDFCYESDFDKKYNLKDKPLNKEKSKEIEKSKETELEL